MLIKWLKSAAFLDDKLNVKLPENFGSLHLKIKLQLLKKHLDRPIRVCGMVKMKEKLAEDHSG
jgi:hypothetical protein